jgi:hypothetical protein
MTPEETVNMIRADRQIFEALTPPEKRPKATIESHVLIAEIESHVLVAEIVRHT